MLPLIHSKETVGSRAREEVCFEPERSPGNDDCLIVRRRYTPHVDRTFIYTRADQAAASSRSAMVIAKLFATRRAETVFWSESPPGEVGIQR